MRQDVTHRLPPFYCSCFSLVVLILTRRPHRKRSAPGVWRQSGRTEGNEISDETLALLCQPKGPTTAAVTGQRPPTGLPESEHVGWGLDQDYQGQAVWCVGQT